MARRTLGFLAIGVGAFMGLGIALNAGEGFGVAAYALAFGFCTLLPVGIGGALLADPRRHRLAEREEHALAAELLRLAEQRGGHLTVAEVMAWLGSSKAEAERALERLAQQGLAEYRVSASGVVVYRVSALLGAEEKRLAEGVLDV
jgi:hypothetical protein